jgi:hypothetical protein
MPAISAAFAVRASFWRPGRGAARPTGFRKIPRYANLFGLPPPIWAVVITQPEKGENMTDTTITQFADSLSRRAPSASTDILELQNTISDIDGLAQEGLRSIEAVAYLTMHWLETTQGTHQNTASILRSALGLIRDRAGNYDQLIGAEARSAGCSNRAEI